MVLKDIPYEQRVKQLNQGFTLIWPFRNVPAGSGPYEVFLDNNALARTSWLSGIDPAMRQKIVLNPMLAFAEQWLSNEHFRADPVKRINEFISPFVKAGFTFPPQYAEDQAQSLKKNANAWRTQWMILYLYVVLLYRITKAKNSDPIPQSLLMQLNQQDVPMFGGCIMLCSFASYLRSNQQMHLVGDSEAAAYSYLNSFISLHGGRKGENEVNTDYLRNRAGDLTLWCLLGSLIQNGFTPAEEPVVLTQDKALAKLIFRCCPGVLVDNRQMSFSPDERTFSEDHRQAILDIIAATRADPSLIKMRASSLDPKRETQLQRLDNLRNYVKKGADSQLSDAIDAVWNEWMVPGFFESFQ